MNGKNDLNAHAVFGDTNRADSVPDRLAPSFGPVYLEGRLVLSLSFQGDGARAHTVASGDEPIECYRLWDDLSDTWYDSELVVLRFEQADSVVRADSRPAAQRAEEALLFSSSAEERGASSLFYAQADSTASSGGHPVVLWEGALNVRARVVPEPDLDEAGMAANRRCDLRWKRIR